MDPKRLSELARRLEQALRAAQEVADELATLGVERIAVKEDKETAETTSTKAISEAEITPTVEEALRKAAEEAKEGRVRRRVDRVAVMTAREIFGPSAKDPTRRYWVLYWKTKDGKEVKLGQIPIPTDPAKVGPRSLAARYLAKYGHLPQVGDEVELKRDEEGWPELVL